VGDTLKEPDMRIRLRPVVFVLATLVVAGSVPAADSSRTAPARVRRDVGVERDPDALLIARGDWAALADRQAARLGDAPAVADLARAIVFADLAGREADVDALETQLLDRAAQAPADADAVAAALLLADRNDAALNALQDASLSRQAFALLLAEMRVADALALPGAEQDPEMALQRAHALAALGSSDAARAELEAIAEPANKGDAATRAVREMAMFGWDGLALERGGSLLADRSRGDRAQAVIPSVFPRTSSEALAAWRWIQADEPGIDPGTALIRVAQALDPATRSADADAMLAAASQAGASLTSCEQVRFFDGMAGIADLRGKPALATQLLQQWADASDAGLAWMALGDRSFDAGRFAEAATDYGHAATAMPAEPVPSYLNALALERAGHAQEAAAARLDADQRAQADVFSRQRLACAMDRAGDFAGARQQRETVVAEGAPGSPSVVAAAQALGQRERCAGSRVTAVADFDRARAQAVMAPALGVARVADLARLSQGARVDAAAEHGAADGALALSEHALAPFLDDIDATADLLRALEADGRSAEADALFRRVFDRMSLAASDVPSARLLNGLAWLSARTARELPAGEAAARRAVELAPQSAAYADTLAEVLFQQGDRDAAVAEGTRALALAREPRYHEAQLARFRTGAPSSRPPLE
jgi:tetratricopeptide (TPR) repeat protein